MHHAYQVIFFTKVFTQTLTIHKTVGEGRAQFLFLYPTSNRSQKFRHFLATLHVRWLQVFLIAPIVSITLLLYQIYYLTTALTCELMMMEC